MIDAPVARQVFLLPGAIHIGAEPALVTTVLGSCIAVCLWDRFAGLGGMNHFVLPADTEGDGSARYGDAAIDRLVDGLRALGGRPANLRAKLFGGAAVLPVLPGPAGDGATVGERNLQMAQARLAHYRIPVVAQRTGGSSGLVIRFHTATGQVILRTVASNAADGGEGLPVPADLRRAEGE